MGNVQEARTLDDHAMEVTVCCVQVGNYCGKGSEYVNKLYHSVNKNLTVPHKFVCFTDNPDGVECETRPIEGEGWYAKLYLFRQFTEGKVIFFDLDTLILQNINFLTKYNGKFAILRDFYRPQGYGSGIMLWRGGFGHDITDRYESMGRPHLSGGDQEFIERHARGKLLQDLFPKKIVSYKAHAMAGVPDSVAVVCFHGYPKPHDFQFGWVKDSWQ